MDNTFIPEIRGILRRHIIEVPESINQVSGIRIFGRLIKSLVFSTDIAVICNINANAVLAVYPFTPQPAITRAILSSAGLPVFTGVGGGITGGRRVSKLAQDAEFQGAMGVVVNAPTPNETIVMLKERIDIPLVVTVVSENTDFDARLEAGTTIFNVSCAAKTAQTVKEIRRRYPKVPIMATGGNNDESILRTIEAGANAITYTPPTPAELMRELMEKYRIEHHGE